MKRHTYEDLVRITSSCTKESVLRAAILAANRHTDIETISRVLLSLRDRFDSSVLEAIRKEAVAGPSDSKIADEILALHEIIYVDGKGFYEWNREAQAMKPISAFFVKKYADFALGRFTSSRRVNAVCDLVKVRAFQEEI